MIGPDAKKSSATIIVFSITLFLSAALMFAIQPMTGKMLLPLIGGAPAGWIVAMAFFQIMLLVGYLVAHLLSTFRPLYHGALYIGALGAGLFFMPMMLSRHIDKVAENPGPADIFLLLTYALAVPFIALSATSSTIQRLFTTTRHRSAGDPYFLYVASNIGSFAGLLLYPFVIEPALSISRQSHYTMVFYTALIALACLCLLLARGNGTAKQQQPQNIPAAAKIPPARYLEWILLAFAPSSLLLGVTIYITTDIMSAPMIWAVPLCLYLLTFIIAFSQRTYIKLELLQKIYPALVFIAIACIGIFKFPWMTQWNGIIFYLGIFFVVALACHMRLAQLRPLEENSRNLTVFYLMMSVGGALGGVLNAFILPFVADRMVELPLILVFSLLLHPALRLKSAQGIIVCAAFILAASMISITPPQITLKRDLTYGIAILLMGVATAGLLFTNRLDRHYNLPNLMAATAAIFLFSQFTLESAQIIYSKRNFYGVIRVYEADLRVIRATDGKTPSAETYRMRYLGHGTTIHGLEILEPAQFRSMPIGYFSKAGPLGDIYEAANPRDVAVVGLGAGVMNCYNAPDRRFTHIEIDADMVDAAERYFSFLSDCPSAAPPRLIVGDGRLELRKLKDDKFDLIFMDAFSSDSIPTHLLTREAVEEYLERLRPEGFIVFHLTNRYFYMESVIASIAASLDLQHRFIVNPFADAPFLFTSKWMVLARKDTDMSKFSDEKHWTTLPPDNTPYWTDDYSNVMSVIHLKSPKTHTYRKTGTK